MLMLYVTFTVPCPLLPLPTLTHSLTQLTRNLPSILSSTVCSIPLPLHFLPPPVHSTSFMILSLHTSLSHSCTTTLCLLFCFSLPHSHKKQSHLCTLLLSSLLSDFPSFCSFSPIHFSLCPNQPLIFQHQIVDPHSVCISPHSTSIHYTTHLHHYPPYHTTTLQHAPPPLPSPPLRVMSELNHRVFIWQCL